MATARFEFLSDIRWATVIILVCVLLYSVIFVRCGVLQLAFFRMGPSDTLSFIYVSVNTWALWSVLGCSSFMASFVGAYLDSVIQPWIMNQIKTEQASVEMEYSKSFTIFAIQMYRVYSLLSNVIFVFMAITQFDFLVLSFLGMLVGEYILVDFYLKKRTFCARTFARVMIRGDDMESGQFLHSINRNSNPGYTETEYSHSDFITIDKI